MTSTPILYIDLAPHPGGSVISLSHLLRGLDRTQWRPMVVLSRQNDFDGFERMGIPVKRVPTPQREKRPAGVVDQLRQGKAAAGIRSTPVLSHIWHWGGTLRHWRRNMWPVVRALTPIIREFDPALIHLNDSVALMQHGALAARRTHTPAIVHGRALVPTSAFDRRILVPGLKGMIFISQAVAQDQLQGVAKPPPVRIIPNAVDIAQFEQPVDREAVRRDLGIPPNAPLVGMIGRIISWKGQHIFIEAFARLRQRYPQAMAILVGDADTVQGEQYGAALRERTRALGLEKNLLWLGHRRDIPQLLGALDMLVHCSVRPEPFGRVLIEGMAAGVPVIASEAGGAVEIVENGVTGLLTPPGDVPALTLAMSRLMEEDALRERLRANGRRRVRERYDIPSHAAAVEDFYRALLGL
jgi:glycosyltransferase involved in cell wall biosynthesis